MKFKVGQKFLWYKKNGEGSDIILTLISEKYDNAFKIFNTQWSNLTCKTNHSSIILENYFNKNFIKLINNDENKICKKSK